MLECKLDHIQFQLVSYHSVISTEVTEFGGVQIGCRAREAAVQCDLQDGHQSLGMKDASVLCCISPISSGPLLQGYKSQSESEISDIDGSQPMDMSYCTFSQASTSL